MLTYIAKRGLAFRMPGKSNLSHMSRRERKWHTNETHAHLKDFTKSERVKEHLKLRKDVFSKYQPKESLSKLAEKTPSSVNKTRRPFLNTSYLTNP